ncbi:uncharacterized protein [Henckelia pumila]|uniref:uncharacterized protein n=1 Tax=Henckelia pumila TaxID=405737 RepID=UPI003C6E2327
MCFELGCGSVRRRRKTKIVIEKEMMDVGAEFKLQSKNEVGFVTKEDNPIERNDGHENTETNEENENMKRDENFERNVEDDNIENSEGNVHIFRNEDEENIVKNEKEMIEAVGNSSEIGSSNDHDNYNDLNLVVQNVINEIKNDVGFDKNDGTVEERKSVSCVGTSKAVIMTSFQSSIVDTVRTRVDRKKKRKASIFVTPPSSSPRPKRKGQKRCIRLKEKCIVDVDENAKSPMKDDLHEFKGRTDYYGHEEASDEEKQILTHYLLMEELDVVIWEDESMMLDGRKFCHFVFGKPVDFEIINVYMRIMQAKSKEYGSEIYCVDTTV